MDLHRLLLLAGAANLSLACSSVVPLSSESAAQLASSGEIPVVYRRSPAPWVFCPADDGRSTWESGGAMNDEPRARPPLAEAGGAFPFVLASARGSGTFVLASDIWQDYVDDLTKGLRVPPEDPARATARDFLDLASNTQPSIPFRHEAKEVARARRQALAESFGSAPVLVFRTADWYLVGCFQTFAPWFSVDAELLDPSTGKVYWRDSCRGDFPTQWGLSPSVLDANGGAIYGRIIGERAARCSKELLASFSRGRGSP